MSFPVTTPRVTLDQNCIIDLEENRSASSDIQRLIARHHSGAISLRLVAISASERQPGGTYAQDFQEFKQKVAAVGLAGMEILLPPWYLGLTFLGQGLLASEAMADLEKQIHEVLFPDVPFEYQDYCASHGIDPSTDRRNPNWVNKRCDVLGLWSHIHHGGDIFVTSDTNFHAVTKKPALIALGAGNILKPAEAVATVGA